MAHCTSDVRPCARWAGTTRNNQTKLWVTEHAPSIGEDPRRIGSAKAHNHQEFQRNVVYANRDLRIAGRRYANRDFLYTNPGDREFFVHESNDRVHKSFDQIDPGGSFGGRSSCVQVCPRALRFAYSEDGAETKSQQCHERKHWLHFP